MKRVFVDANVFLKFFAPDVSSQKVAARKLLTEAAAGKIALVTGLPVLFEIAWVLKSVYKVNASRRLDILESIISAEGLTVTDGELVAEAIQLARDRNIGFADAYIAASAKKSADEVATFNVNDFKHTGVPLHKL